MRQRTDCGVHAAVLDALRRSRRVDAAVGVWVRLNGGGFHRTMGTVTPSRGGGGDRSDAAFDASSLGETIREALDHADISVTIIGERDGTLERLFINPAGARALGYDPNEAEEIPPLFVPGFPA